jgi:diguanylate cyclase (GGDEF)-like protein
MPTTERQRVALPPIRFVEDYRPGTNIIQLEEYSHGGRCAKHDQYPAAVPFWNTQFCSEQGKTEEPCYAQTYAWFSRNRTSAIKSKPARMPGHSLRNFSCRRQTLSWSSAATEAFLEANPQAELLFGYGCSELLGKSVEVLIPERFRAAHATHRAAGQFVLGVIRDISERKRLEEKLRQLASSDALTGLGNYRRLQEAFDTETKWLDRVGRSCAVLLIDVDGLKKINDIHGHLEGDRALCRLAKVLRLECQAVDTATRHGGDEFAVILPDTNTEGAHNLASRAASRLASEGEGRSVSFSYGVGVLPDDGKTLHQLLAVADHFLYEMKKSKR